MNAIVQKLNRCIPILGIFQSRPHGLFLILVLCQCAVNLASSVANANKCVHSVQEANEKKNNKWLSKEAAIAKKLEDSLAGFGLKGPSAVPGALLAALYAKSIAQDLQSKGHIDEGAAVRAKAFSMNGWASMMINGSDVMLRNNLDLPTSQAVGADRVIERTMALFDKVDKIGPTKTSALVVAIEIAKMNAVELISEGNATGAVQIIERAKVANEWLGLLTDGTQSRFEKP